MSAGAAEVEAPQIQRYRFWHPTDRCSNGGSEMLEFVQVTNGLVVIPNVRCNTCGQQCYHEKTATVE